MLKLISKYLVNQEHCGSEQCGSGIKESIEMCEAKFRQILSEILEGGSKEAHKVEAHIFKRLMELGLLLLNLFFIKQNKGNYGERINTSKGIAKRGRVSERGYFSIFGKLRIERYMYHIGEESFSQLDILLNLPTRCYSYFLSEMVNLLNIKGAYAEGAIFLERFFNITLSVSAAETISSEGSMSYEHYYDSRDSGYTTKEGDLTVVSFDGKGVPMIKKEAAQIKSRQGKGEKRQKKKEALVGVGYTINPNIRTPEEVANNLIFPEDRKNKQVQKAKAQDIRYIASVERPKKEVMEEIKAEIKDKSFDSEPLICVMDGAKSIWNIFKDVFAQIKNKVLILDIIHVLEYIWLIAHMKYKEGSNEAKAYVYEKLLLILKGKVASYIMELQKEMCTGDWKKAQLGKFTKVITYLKNHKEYMKYDQYLSCGYPIGTGVVESACSHVVKNRMEISGARWGIPGAESILRLRSIVKSNDWDKYWEFYTQQARRGDLLSAEANSINLKHKKAA